MNIELKNSFETLKDYKNDIQNVLHYINNKNNLLTDMYNEYLKDIIDKLNYKISLDTFNFQTKLIKIEHDNYNKIFRIFLNRIYGDYYKLYKKLIEYVNTNVKDVKIINNNDYPKYKDLDTLTEYSFDIIENIYLEMLSIISELSNYCLKEEHIIKEIEKKQDNGINIHNFLNEKKYSIIILQEKIKFFYDIINGYITFQLKFFKRLYLKLKLIYSQLCSDINLETSISKNKKNNIIDSPNSNCDIYKVDSFSSSENAFEIKLEKQLNNINLLKNSQEDNGQENNNQEDDNSQENNSQEEDSQENSTKKKKKKKKKNKNNNTNDADTNYTNDANNSNDANDANDTATDAANDAINVKIFDDEKLYIVSSSSNNSDDTFNTINLE